MFLSRGRSLAFRSIKRNVSFTAKDPKEIMKNHPRMVNLTFVDEEGNRATVQGRVGQTLLEAALMHKVDIADHCGGGAGPQQVHRTDDWLEDTYGQGPGCYACHVKIPSSFHHLLPKEFDYIRQGMENVWGGEMSSTSRLACQITLEKKHDGMVVFVPDQVITNMCI